MLAADGLQEPREEEDLDEISVDVLDLVEPPASDDFEFGAVESGDTVALKAIHESCFPVHYNDKFYADVGKGVYMRKPLITVMARKRKTYRKTTINSSAGIESSKKRCIDQIECDTAESCNLVGGITAQIQELDPSDEDQPWLSRESKRKGYTRGCYVLTLATSEEVRRQRIGSRLLESVVEKALQDETCGVIYLHVITYNEGAIRFYERHGFKRLATCKAFYKIDNKFYNAYLYALFLRDAEPAGRVESFWGSIVTTVSSLFRSFFG